MTRFFKATFSNGYTQKRSSASRDYTHAYQYVTATDYRQVGFSTSEAQCHANLASESAWTVKHRGALKFAEVVPVEEITAKEYRSKEPKDGRWYLGDKIPVWS